jgi:hypothetical protein
LTASAADGIGRVVVAFQEAERKTIFHICKGADQVVEFNHGTYAAETKVKYGKALVEQTRILLYCQHCSLRKRSFSSNRKFSNLA